VLCKIIIIIIIRVLCKITIIIIIRVLCKIIKIRKFSDFDL